MLYHYTDRLSAAEIRRDGLIKARPITLHRDVLGKDKGFTTLPIVWLTINPMLDMTVVSKLMLGGISGSLVGELWRFVLPHDYAPYGLGEYVDMHQIDDTWCTWIVRTGEMIGSNYTTWRLHSADIPSRDWVAVESLLAIGSSAETRWATHV